MSTVTQVITADELLRMPDDGFRYELVKGELRKMPLEASEHGTLAMRLGAGLHHYVEANDLGLVFAAETGFKLASNPDTVRAPDVAYVSKERVEAAGVPKGYWPGAPDLAIEVISPDDVYGEVEDKVMDWLGAGTRMVIVVNPRRRTVSVHRPGTAKILTGDDILSGEDVVPGWAVPVKDLFS